MSAASSDPSNTGPRAGSPLVVLVVDDSSTAARTLARLLRSKEIAVVQAQDGHEALAYLESGRVDVVVSDARMPELDGVALLRIVSERWPHVARVLYTGYVDSYVTDETDSMNFIDRVFSKGGQDEETVALVRALAQHSSVRIQSSGGGSSSSLC